MRPFSPAKFVPPQGRAAPLDPDAHRHAEASGRRATPLAQARQGKEKKILTGLPMTLQFVAGKEKGTTSVPLDGGAPTLGCTHRRQGGQGGSTARLLLAIDPRVLVVGDAEDGKVKGTGPLLLQARLRAAVAGREARESPAIAGKGTRGFYLMSCIKDVPTLRGDNYTEWRKKVDFAFVCAEVDWVVDTPQPIKPTDPVRADGDTDDAWAKKKRDHAPVEMSYTLENRKWQTANKKCMAFIKNTIENAIVGSITECASAGEYLEKIKSQFTGSSKTYATQLLKQLVTEK
ncbi:hypothetical protein QYE76_058564 [Lolium multiflorum]|uniref:Uncharacterized protein n=1 Tax=Lolium multiflorum TaxID=4521 RepID=A0AAD8WSJ9_LOLMU|nr:hypothetical protein QYE76_058564 [Lolium multiflorum]